MSKNDDLEILNCIYKNSKMAADCIDSVQAAMASLTRRPLRKSELIISPSLVS